MPEHVLDQGWTGGDPGLTICVKHDRRSTFDREALIRAVRTDQAGESTFPEFLTASWHQGWSGTTSISRRERSYVEAYPAVEIE